MNLKRAHPQFNLGNVESLAGAKEKMRVATTLPAVFTRVSSTISVGMSSNNLK